MKRLRFMILCYNAALNQSSPDVRLRIDNIPNFEEFQLIDLVQN
jgi:hypothetical protein